MMVTTQIVVVDHSVRTSVCLHGEDDAHTHFPTVCVPRYGRYDPSLRRPQLHELNDFEKTVRDSNVVHNIMRKLCHDGDGLKGCRRSQYTSKCVFSMVKTLTKVPVCCVQNGIVRRIPRLQTFISQAFRALMVIRDLFQNHRK
jgi:hypothetical protein